MKINVLFSYINTDELAYTGKTTVVIDVLRASTTIIQALQNGAREVIPVASVEFAVKVSGGMFGGQTLLGGERNTKKLEGFALGNSPLEYAPEVVGGRTIILFTTNGSKAIVKAKFSENLFIAAFTNLNTLANHLIKLDKEFEILCSGRGNYFSMEDVICAGKLISEIQKINNNVELTDSAKASVALNKSFGKSILTMMQQTEHGKILIENNFDEDLKFCSRINTSETIPYLISGVLKAL
ncbi:MAG TPA: 2-phosphosulfolactate phosphatase [Ignavibacteriaceae bacterium]